MRGLWLGLLILALAATACDDAASPPPEPAVPPKASPAKAPDDTAAKAPEKAPAKTPTTKAPTAAAKAPTIVPSTTDQPAAQVTGDPRKVMIAAGSGNLDVEPRLLVADIQAATGTKTAFVPALLQGIKPSPTYGRARLAPEDRAHYGVGLQVWTAKDLADAKARMAIHRKTYRGAAPSKAVGREAITAKQHTIRHLSWIRGDASEVITLTCDERLCSAQQLAVLARLVDRR